MILPTGERADLATKFRGTLLGVAVGDALGATFEGAPSVPRDRLDRLRQEPSPLRYTDDTHMTLGLATALLDRGGFDGEHVASVWGANFMTEPWRGYGPGPAQIFGLLRVGVPWDKAGQQLYGGRGSWGNGAAMRVAPVALLAVADLDHVAWLARQTAIITHVHELGVEGAVLQALAITLLLRQPLGISLDVPPFLETLRAYAGTLDYCRQLDIMGTTLAGGAPAPERVAALLGHGVAAHESVGTALYAFLRHRDDFAAVVTFAIGLGGDTDTIAAMAGALAGAYLGEAAIPFRWRSELEGANLLRAQADALLELVRDSGTPAPQSDTVRGDVDTAPGPPAQRSVQRSRSGE